LAGGVSGWLTILKNSQLRSLAPILIPIPSRTLEDGVLKEEHEQE
jgi:hypothetical protein